MSKVKNENLRRELKNRQMISNCGLSLFLILTIPILLCGIVILGNEILIIFQSFPYALQVFILWSSAIVALISAFVAYMIWNDERIKELEGRVESESKSDE